MTRAFLSPGLRYRSASPPILQAMMDIDGNGRVSYDELLQTAKQSMEASRKMADAAGGMPDDVLQVWTQYGHLFSLSSIIPPSHLSVHSGAWPDQQMLIPGPPPPPPPPRCWIG